MKLFVIKDNFILQVLIVALLMNSIEEILWIKKYFIPLSELDWVALVIRIGINIILFISILIHIVNQFDADKLHKILRISIIKMAIIFLIKEEVTPIFGV